MLQMLQCFSVEFQRTVPPGNICSVVWTSAQTYSGVLGNAIDSTGRGAVLQPASLLPVFRPPTLWSNKQP